MKINKLFKAMSVAGVLVLSGCATTDGTGLADSLEVSTKMSSTIWLDPVGSDKRTIFLSLRNTSDKDMNIANQISEAIVSKGYKVVTNPDEAHYWIQGNILKVGKSTDEETDSFLDTGFGGGVVGGVLGSTIGGGNGKTVATVGGALAGYLIDKAFEDTMYTMVTDLQISEASDETVLSKSNHQLSQGNSGSTVQASEKSGNRKKYQTRIVSTAIQSNLAFEQARPELESGLIRSISGLL